MRAIEVSRPVSSARSIARYLLAGREDRWRHTIGVAARAEEVAATVAAEDRGLLVAAAWLHDIGYADALVVTGLHSLDGADHLVRTGWPYRLAALVAHHSGAAYVAEVQGLADALGRYDREDSAVTDALTYADQTTGPLGQRVDVHDRIAEVLRRHGPLSAQAKAYPVRAPYLLGVAERVRQRLH
jgi:putative nucleotidyltransferase with HDIG domain